MVNIEEMLENAVFDGAIYCPFCKHGHLEADYDKCPQYHKENPLRRGGFI